MVCVALAESELLWDCHRGGLVVPRLLAFLVPLVLLIGSPRPARAESVRLAISHFSPFVSLENPDRPEGFSIDLWRAVAKDMGLDYEFVICSGVVDKLNTLERDGADIAIGGITITETREERVDFTHPCFHTGLDILVPLRNRFSLRDRLAPLLTKTKLVILGSFLVLILMAGHLMWYAEKGKDMFSDHYIPGVLEGMYWAIVTASTVGYGDKAPVKWAGRILAGVVIIVSLPLFALFTAELSSTFTLLEIRSSVEGPGDLAGKRVGVVAGTTSATHVSRLSAQVQEYEAINDAYTALLAGRLDAVVYDAPNLHHFANTEGLGKTTVVGKKFSPQELAFATQSDSPLRERLNRALLRVAESGEMGRLKERWFGRADG